MELAGFGVEEAVSESAAEALVKEDEQQGDADGFVGEAIGIVLALGPGQQAAKQLCKGLHRFPPLTLASRARSSDKEPMEIKISNMFE